MLGLVRLRFSHRAFASEFRKWSFLSLLAGLGLFAENLPWLISNIMIGHVSTEALAALGLVEIWLYSFLEVIWSGVGLTESVMVSQAHGKRRLVAMRGWAVISLAVMTAGNVVITCLCLTVGPTLKAFGLNPALVDLGKVYALYLIPAIFIEGVNVCTSTYLCSLQAPVIPTVIRLFGVLVDVLVSYIFIFGIAHQPSVFHNALIGSAIGWIASAGVILVLNFCAVVYLWGHELEFGDDEADDDLWADGKKMAGGGANVSTLQTSPRTHAAALHARAKSVPGRQTSGGFRKTSASSVSALVKGVLQTSTTTTSIYERLLGEEDEDEDEDEDGGAVDPVAASDIGTTTSLAAVVKWVKHPRRWQTYAKQALPNCLTILLQCSVFTFLSFLAANLGTVEIAAHNQNVALLEVAFTFVGGMAEGTAVRVGFHIGRSNAEGAKTVVALAFAVNVLVGLAAGSLGYIFRSELANCLSSDPEVRAVSVTLAPLLWGTFAFFSVGEQALGVLEGQGRAAEQAGAFLIGCVGVTVPLALVSYFATDYGLVGLWWALFVGFLLSEVIAVWLVVFHSDWDRLVAYASNRLVTDDEDEKAQEKERENNEQLMNSIMQIAASAASRSRDDQEALGSLQREAEEDDDYLR